MASIKDVKIGLDIFAKHLGEDTDCLAAEHDELYGPSAERLKSKLTAEDKKALKDAGWMKHSAHDCWYIFV